MLQTARMRLVPFRADLVRAEMEDRPAFAQMLGATVPVAWPPEMLADALPWFLKQLEAAPEHTGWFGWYGLWCHETGAELVAGAGFKGPPSQGTVEIGYSVLPGFQGRGFATEMVGTLVRWAFAQPGVQRIIAETMPDNTPSLRLLGKLGFTAGGPAVEPGHLRLALLNDHREQKVPA
jgi:RimJ/RimL family protein N-acetyltransferase